MKTYTKLKAIGGLLMVSIGAWAVPVVSDILNFGTLLNQLIAACGVGLMIFLSYLESKGEI